MWRKWLGMGLIGLGVFATFVPIAQFAEGDFGTVGIVAALIAVALFWGGTRITKTGEEAIAVHQEETAVELLRTRGLPPGAAESPAAAQGAGSLSKDVRESLRRHLAKGLLPMAPSDFGYSCLLCGLEAETRHVSLIQNTGMLIARSTRTVDGFLCRTCIEKTVKEFNTHNWVMGWWGLISFVVTIGALATNSGARSDAKSMTPPDRNAAVPHPPGSEASARLLALAPTVADLLAQGRPPDEVLRQVAGKAGTTPAGAAIFLRDLAATPERGATVGREPLG